MTRLACLAAFVTAAAVIVGCEPAKELPSDVPRGTEPTGPTEKVPVQSDPATKAFVEKAVKAYTGGKPELVAKGKYSRLALKGKEVWPQTPNWAEAMRSVAAVWPDRYHGLDELQLQGNRLIVEAWRHKPRVTVMFGGQEANQLNPQELDRILATDATAQHWMSLMVPLTDPKAVVYDLQSQSGTSPAGQKVSMQTLKLALPDLPVYQLTFDVSNSALIRVDYVLTQAAVPSPRTWIMLDHKVSPEGLLLPTKMSCRWGNDFKEEWEESKWEFPETIKDEEFSPPKK